jgi:glutathione S-transferase
LSTFPGSAQYVRWSLDALKEPYEEVENVGILGVLFFGRMVPALHIPKYKTTVNNSRDIVCYLHGKHVLEDRAAFLRPVGGLAVELEDKFEKLGGHTRRWMYYTLFHRSGERGRELTLRAWGRHQSRVQLWQRLALSVLYPVLKAFVSKPLRIDESSFRRSVAEINKTFDEVDALLADGRKFVLATPEKTYLDIYLACMAALVILPPGYSGGRIEQQSRLEPNDFSPGIMEEVKTWRSRPTGQFVLRMYANERLQKQL